MITLDRLTSACASVEIKNAAGQALSIDGSGFLTISNSSFTVTATNLDIRDLLFASDSVDVTGSEVSLDAATLAALETTTVVPGGYGSWKTSNQTVGVAESELASTPLTGRGKVTVQNFGPGEIYVSEATGVGTSDLAIPCGSSWTENLDDVSNIFAISDTAGTDVRIAEYAA